MDSLDFETQLVSSMMINGDHPDTHEIIGKLPAEAFENSTLREMYKAISSLIAQCEPTDPFTVRECVPESCREHVVTVSASCTSAANMRAWAKRVRQCWMIRTAKQNMLAAIEILDGTNTKNLNANMSEIAKLVGALEMESNDRLPRRLSEVLPDWVDVLDKRLAGKKSGLYLQVGIEPMDEKYGGFDRTDLIVIAGQPGMGKMLSNETPILLESGMWVTHGTVRVGDKLASVDGKPSTVTGVFPKGMQDIYLVGLEDGRVIESGAEHLWEVESSRFKGSRVMNTIEIMGRNESGGLAGRMRLPKISGDFGALSDEDAWVIGALIGDGGITQCVKFTNSEDYMIDRMRNSIRGLSMKSIGIEHLISGRGDNWLLVKLRELGLFGKKSAEKFIPDIYFAANKKTRAELLIGILETDGWFEKSGSLVFGSSSEDLRDGVVRLVHSLGGSATKTKRLNVGYIKNGEKVGCRDSYKTCIRLPEDIKSMIKSPRLLKNMKKTRFVVDGIKIKSVTKAGYQKECTCIMVDHDRHLYVAGDYVATHNTELAIMMANYIGSQRGVGLFVSMEMSDTQVAERHIADRSGLSVGKLRNPTDMYDEDYARMSQAIAELNEQDNYILDHTMTVDEIISHAERLARGDNGLAFLAIDYLGLIIKAKAERNDIAIGDITRKLKKFALQFKVPVILLSQLNRNVAQRQDKRPIIQDLRDSGSIEQDADVIIFPYRDEVHDKDTRLKGVAEIIVAKYRSGEPGTFYMGWRNGHFVNIDQGDVARMVAENERRDEGKKEKSSGWM